MEHHEHLWLRLVCLNRGAVTGCAGDYSIAALPSSLPAAACVFCACTSAHRRCRRSLMLYACSCTGAWTQARQLALQGKRRQTNYAKSQQTKSCAGVWMPHRGNWGALHSPRGAICAFGAAKCQRERPISGPLNGNCLPVHPRDIAQQSCTCHPCQNDDHRVPVSLRS